MLDDANSDFINTAVTVIRYGFYLWLGAGALAIVFMVFVWLFGAATKGLETISSAWDRSIGRFLPNAEVKWKKRLRDLGY